MHVLVLVLCNWAQDWVLFLSFSAISFLSWARYDVRKRSFVSTFSQFPLCFSRTKCSSTAERYFLRNNKKKYEILIHKQSKVGKSFSFLFQDVYNACHYSRIAVWCQYVILPDFAAVYARSEERSAYHTKHVLVFLLCTYTVVQWLPPTVRFG